MIEIIRHLVLNEQMNWEMMEEVFKNTTKKTQEEKNNPMPLPINDEK